MLKSLKELYVIGPGPSSSHTIGPFKATKDFIEKEFDKDFEVIQVILYGSLALTGKGHLTDKIILDVLQEYKEKEKLNFNIDIKFDIKEHNLMHPNTMKFIAFKKGKMIKEVTYFSIGGGEILKNNLEKEKERYVYPFSSFKQIEEYCLKNYIHDLSEFVDQFDKDGVDEYLEEVLKIMLESVEKGLEKQGVIPGNLHLERVAKKLFNKTKDLKDNDVEKLILLLTSFSYAVSENNACGDIVVTAPTCGSSGIIPSILYYYKNYLNTDDKKLINGLKVASIFGNLAKENATISGAVGGCQAEIGVASSMGAALFSYLNNLSIYQIEYSSELALEHFLGLTCDPVEGYVQIPCIERNGIGVLRSYSASLYAKNIAPLRHNRVTFDEVLRTMKMTGDDLSYSYKETSIGGLAKVKKLD